MHNLSVHTSKTQILRIISGLFAVFSITFMLLDFLGVTATPTYHLAELPLIGLAVFLFGYFAVKGRLPKPFQR